MAFIEFTQVYANHNPLERLSAKSIMIITAMESNGNLMPDPNFLKCSNGHPYFALCNN